MAERFPYRGYDILTSCEWSNWCVSNLSDLCGTPLRLSIDIGHF